MEENEKKTLTQRMEEHPTTVFWLRFVAWTFCSLILPASFIIWRFDLFKKISKIQLGGWSIFIIILVAFFVFTIIRYVRLAFKGRYSFIGQCLTGFCKIILPLLAALFIIHSLKNTIEMLIQVFGCIIICEAIAIPLNPLPKWAYEMQKDISDAEKKDYVDYCLDGFFRRKKEEEKK